MLCPRAVCTRELPQVEQKYLANIYIDDLPIYGPVGIERELGIYVNQRCEGSCCAMSRENWKEVSC